MPQHRLNQAACIIFSLVVIGVGTSFSSEQGRPRLRASIGKLAPEFTLSDQNGKKISLVEHRGRSSVVLAFYPFAFTPGCGSELSAIQGQLERLQAAHTQVYGVSTDSVFVIAKFRDELGLSYPLLSDKNRKITKRYGLLDTQTGASRRATFLIDKKGVIRKIYLDHAALDPAALVEAAERLSKE